MRGDYEDYRTPRRPPVNLDRPVYRSERVDWLALTHAYVSTCDDMGRGRS